MSSHLWLKTVQNDEHFSNICYLGQCETMNLLSVAYSISRTRLNNLFQNHLIHRGNFPSCIADIDLVLRKTPKNFRVSFNEKFR